MHSEALPVISWNDPDCGERFVASLREFGFSALIDHPLDMARVGRIYSDWQTFFAEGNPDAYRMDPERQDGYFSTAEAEHAKGYERRDFKEYFQYYPWGRCPAELLPDIAGHYQQALEVASQLLRWVGEYAPASAVGGLSEPLEQMIQGSEQSMLRVLHYPPVPEGIEVTRAAPHEDINLLTILPASDGPGLEIKRQDGSWLSVPNRPNQILINIGDMLQEASGGYFPSTTHQVAAPSGEQVQRGRMSLPLFLHPRPEVVLSSRYTAKSYLSQRLHELGVV
jgi:isopenicillin N synthase-like dioxygenase